MTRLSIWHVTVGCTAVPSRPVGQGQGGGTVASQEERRIPGTAQVPGVQRQALELNFRCLLGRHALATRSVPTRSEGLPISQTSRVGRISEGGFIVTAPAWSVSRRQMRAQRIRNVVPSSMRPINPRRGFMPDAPGPVSRCRRSGWLVTSEMAGCHADDKGQGGGASSAPRSDGFRRQRRGRHDSGATPPGRAMGLQPALLPRFGPRPFPVPRGTNRISARRGEWSATDARQANRWPCRRAGHQSQPAHTYAPAEITCAFGVSAN